MKNDEYEDAPLRFFHFFLSAHLGFWDHFVEKRDNFISSHLVLNRKVLFDWSRSKTLSWMTHIGPWTQNLSRRRAI